MTCYVELLLGLSASLGTNRRLCLLSANQQTLSHDSCRCKHRAVAWPVVHVLRPAVTMLGFGSGLTLCSGCTGTHVPCWMSSDLIKVNGAGWEPPPLPSVQNMGWAMSRRCDAMDGQTQRQKRVVVPGKGIVYRANLLPNILGEVQSEGKSLDKASLRVQNRHIEAVVQSTAVTTVVSPDKVVNSFFFAPADDCCSLFTQRQWNKLDASAAQSG